MFTPQESPPKIRVPDFTDTNIYENVPKQTPEGVSEYVQYYMYINKGHSCSP